MIVVLIAVLVTMAAVPAYRKAQERNRYMSALGVLMEMGNAERMLHEQYPSLVFSSNFTSNATWTECPSDPAEDVKVFLQCNDYLTEIPFSGSTFQGYSYKISLTGTASCSGCSGTGVACMYDSDASVSDYRCAYIDKSGNLYHN